ncbi:MAG TPA: hypothetical protein PKK36_09845 [Kiritimatiellia bacterium]|nr:hypothetical protein [Kiritimatiellia bacterium]
MNRVFVIILLLHAAGCAQKPAPETNGGPFTLKMNLSTNVIHVGDVVTMELNAVHPAETVLRIPEVGRGKELIVRRQGAETFRSGDKLKTFLRYELTSFEIGDHLFPSGMVECVRNGEIISTLPFPAGQVTVESVLGPKDRELRDIEGLAAWPGIIPRWVWALLLVAGLAVAAALILGRFLSRPRTILQVPEGPPPHERALRAMARLREKDYIANENVEPFYVELSAIIRTYLEDRFNLRAPERTTEEFIREAANSRLLSAPHQQLTRDFLEQSDLVKFARHRPGRQEMLDGLAAGEALVKETAPREEVPA